MHSVMVDNLCVQVWFTNTILKFKDFWYSTWIIYMDAGILLLKSVEKTWPEMTI